MLDLNWNTLSGHIPSVLANCYRITLDLERNRLTGPIPPEPGGLTRLWSLDLSRNSLP